VAVVVVVVVVKIHISFRTAHIDAFYKGEHRCTVIYTLRTVTRTPRYQ
jgi:hypothetical protein